MGSILIGDNYFFSVRAILTLKCRDMRLQGNLFHSKSEYIGGCYFISITDSYTSECFAAIELPEAISKINSPQNSCVNVMPGTAKHQYSMNKMDSSLRFAPFRMTISRVFSDRFYNKLLNSSQRCKRKPCLLSQIC